MMSYSKIIRDFVATQYFGCAISDFGKEWNADPTDRTD